MFQFAEFATLLESLGLPHSDISGSMLASSSPECFVGRHVLHRLYVPRYPPLALSRLTCFFGLILLSATFIDFAFAPSIGSPTSWLLFCLCSFQGAILEMTPAFSFLRLVLCFSVVEISGLEPLTSCLQSRRSTS